MDVDSDVGDRRNSGNGDKVSVSGVCKEWNGRGNSGGK